MKLNQTKNKYLKRKQKRKTLRYRRGGDIYDDMEREIEDADLPTLINFKELFKGKQDKSVRERDIERIIQQKINLKLPEGDGIYAVAKEKIEEQTAAKIEQAKMNRDTRVLRTPVSMTKFPNLEERISTKEHAGIEAYNIMAQNEIAKGMDPDYYDPQKSELAKSIRDETIRNGALTFPGVEYKPKYNFFGGKKYKRNKLCTKKRKYF
jgi:hypothetical protein